MKRAGKKRNSEMKQLEKENSEQMETIQSLWSELGLPSGPEILDGRPVVIPHNVDYQQRIAELEAILAKKKENYAIVEQQIVKYVQDAEMYEDQLLQNEAEKARLLMSFQNGAGGSTSELAIEELESCIEDMQNSREKLKEEKEVTIKMCQRMGSKLKSSRDKLSALMDEKNRLMSYSSLGVENFRQILFDRETTVQELRARLADCHRTLERLREDNALLKNALSSDDSDM